MKILITTLISAHLLLACSSNKVTNTHNPELVFSNIQSDFIVEDINNYDCSRIDITTLNYIFSTASPVSQRDVHDNFSTVGCSIKGQLTSENENIGFIFDYGGIIYLDDGKIMACGEGCCQNNFKYCSWEKQKTQTKVDEF
jgi:hypothetical protein